MIDIKNRAISLLAPDGDWMWDDGNLIWCSENVIQPTEAEIQAKIAEIQAAEPMRQLREQRNQLLAQSDWMAVSDRTMSPEQIAYRQSLRDMPANNPEVALNDAGELINITWPTEPS